MSDELERRWDDAVETAWREFRRRLADRLADLAGPLVVEVSAAVAGDDVVAPYCQVWADDGWLRVEAVSNAYLDEPYLLDPAGEDALEELGFSWPGEPTCEPDTDPGDGPANFWTDVEQREADRAAVLVVRALREVYAVVHPAYLDADGLEPTAEPEQDGDLSQQEGARDLSARDLPARDPSHRVLRPTTPAEVRAAVDLAVAGLYDPTPEWDEDGDLPLTTEKVVVWVTVATAAPRILVHGTLVDDVTDERRALVEVNLLNQREFGLTFALREGRITVVRELGLDVVVPAVLQGELQRILGDADQWASDLAARLGPEEADGDGDAEGHEVPTGRYATAYAVLRELERDRRGSVEPATMVRIFEADTGLLLRALQETDEQLRAARGRLERATERGNPGRVRVSRGHVTYLRTLRTRLRRALRLVVDAPARKSQVDQLALFDEDECGTGRG